MNIRTIVKNQQPNNNHAMTPEKLHDYVIWLNSQVEHLTAAINEAHDGKNFGREAQFEGMRDAFMRCLNKLVKD